jgi:glycosyltransferase involved in cell wall biosynthesis
LKVLLIVPSLSSVWGGVSTAIGELMPCLIQRGINMEIYATEGYRTGISDIQPENVLVRAYPTDVTARIWTGHSYHLKKALQHTISGFDLVHIHELWHYPAYIGAREAICRSKPFIVTVHGELEPWTLQYKGLKKRIYSRLIQRRQLNSAAAIQCLTRDEADQVRQYGVNAPTRVIPNGISIKHWDPPPAKAELLQKYPQLENKQIILFLGRIHQKKGLDQLIAAFNRVLQKYRDGVQLVIAGPDDGYEKELLKSLHELNITDQVLMLGLVTGRDKYVVLESADIFALPSYSEGFSVAILEAMSSGTPVIISKQCHFPEVEQQRAGMVISNGTDQLYEAMDRLLAEPELGCRMGENGRKLAREKYTWDESARQLADLYHSVAGKS